MLLLDVAGVSFCDACGLSALVRIANHADRTGCRYGIIAPQPLLVKILRITGLGQRLPVFTSINEAAIVLGYDTQTRHHRRIGRAQLSATARADDREAGRPDRGGRTACVLPR